MKTNIKSALSSLLLVLPIAAMVSFSACSKSDLAPASNAATADFSAPATSLDVVKAVTVYPNPTTGPIVVVFTTYVAESYTIQVLDNDENPLMVTSGLAVSGSNKIHLNLTPFGKGTYYILFQSAQQSQVVQVKVEYP